MIDLLEKFVKHREHVLPIHEEDDPHKHPDHPMWSTVSEAEKKLLVEQHQTKMEEEAKAAADKQAEEDTKAQ